MSTPAPFAAMKSRHDAQIEVLRAKIRAAIAGTDISEAEVDAEIGHRVELLKSSVTPDGPIEVMEKLFGQIIRQEWPARYSCR